MFIPKTPPVKSMVVSPKYKSLISTTSLSANTSDFSFSNGGNKVDYDQELVYEGVTILPTKKHVNLSVCSLRRIVEDAKKKESTYPSFKLTVSEFKSIYGKTSSSK